MSADFSWTNYFGALIILIRCLSWTQCMNMDRRKRPRYYLSWNSMDMFALFFMAIIINHHLKWTWRCVVLVLERENEALEDQPGSQESDGIVIITFITKYIHHHLYQQRFLQPPLSPYFQLFACRDDDDCEKDGKASTKVFHQPSWDPQASEQVRHLDHHHPWWSST